MMLLTWCRRSERSSARTEHHLRTLTRLWSDGPIRRSAAIVLSILPTQWTRLRHSADCGAHRCCYSYRVRVIISTAFYTVSRRQECIEPLNEFRIARKQGADPANYAWSIYGTALEVFHDVEEAIVHVWNFSELDFDLIEIAESVVQDWLLSLALTLALGLWLVGLLLLSRLWVLIVVEGHEHASLHLLTARAL